MKRRRFLGVSLLLVVGAGRGFAQDTDGGAKASTSAKLEVPDDLNRQLQQMRTASERMFSDSSYSWNVTTIFKAFYDAADAAQRVLRPSVARRLSAVESASPEAKLTTILADLKQRPEVYTEIENRYIRGVADPYSRFPRPPRLLPEHATETYRLVWEYILLRPDCVTALDPGPMSIQALAVIHNPATLMTAIESFRIATQTSAPIPNSRDRQEQIIDLLRVFQDTPEGKAAMEQCLHLADEQSTRMLASGKHYPRVRYLKDGPEWTAWAYAHSPGRKLWPVIP